MRRNKINRKAVMLKITFVISIAVIWNLVVIHLSPIVENELALLQMGNSVDSSFLIHVYSGLKNYIWIAFAILVMSMFRKELAYIFKLVASKIKEDFNNEEH